MRLLQSLSLLNLELAQTEVHVRRARRHSTCPVLLLLHLETQFGPLLLAPLQLPLNVSLHRVHN